MAVCYSSLDNYSGGKEIHKVNDAGISVNELVKRVIADFERDNKEKVWSKELEESLESGIADQIKDKDLEDAYAVCMYMLCTLVDEFGDMEGITRSEIDSVMLEVIHDDTPEDLTDYRWIPDCLLEVYIHSGEIFDLAKHAYSSSEVSKADIDEAKAHLDAIESLGSKLDGYKYTYRNRDELQQIYLYELSESRMDYETVKGEQIIRSKRLSNYLGSKWQNME